MARPRRPDDAVDSAASRPAEVWTGAAAARRLGVEEDAQA